MQSLILSFDISTTNIGIALWDTDGILLELKHLELKVDKSVEKEDRDIVKAETFMKYIQTYKERIKTEYNGGVVTNVFVEAPIQNTSVNINTTALLLGFNGMCCYNLYSVFHIIPKRINISDCRRIFCNEFINIKKIKGLTEEVLSFPKGWKSPEKKTFIQKKVQALEPQIEWFYKKKSNELDETSYDMSDAYACGIAGLVQFGFLLDSQWKEKCSKLSFTY